MVDENLSPDKLAKLSNAELLELSTQRRERILNPDWQRMVLDLQNSGHIHTYRETAPLLLQRFLMLEIDLDEELSRRGLAAPLMSSLALDPCRPRNERRLLATLTSQDGGALMQVEVQPTYENTIVSFSIKNMLTLRFNLPNLSLEERQDFIENMRRDNGLSVLWTPERWEQDYLIFVKHEHFSRAYAFSGQFEANVRLTNEVTGNLMDWIERAWFPSARDRRRNKRTTQILRALNAPLPDPDNLPAPSSAPETPIPAPEVAEGVLNNVLGRLQALPQEQRDHLRRDAPQEQALLNRIFATLDQAEEQHRTQLKDELKKQPVVVARLYLKLDQLQKQRPTIQLDALPNIKSERGEKSAPVPLDVELDIEITPDDKPQPPDATETIPHRSAAQQDPRWTAVDDGNAKTDGDDEEIDLNKFSW